MGADVAARVPGLPALPARSRWGGLVAFALTELRVQAHETLALATSMIIQTVFIVFVWILSPSLLPYTVVGAVIFSVFQVGERVTNEAAYIRIDHRLSELYHASPLRPEAYFVGMAVGVMTAYLPPVIFLFALAQVLHLMSWTAVLVFLATLLAIFLFASSLGYVFSTLFQDSRAIWPYSSIFYNAFGVLPPVFYPLANWRQIIPAPIEPLALLLPPSAAASLVTWSEGLPLSQMSTGEVLTATVALLVEALGVFLFAVHRARQAARER